MCLLQSGYWNTHQHLSDSTKRQPQTTIPENNDKQNSDTKH